MKFISIAIGLLLFAVAASTVVPPKKPCLTTSPSPVAKTPCPSQTSSPTPTQSCTPSASPSASASATPCPSQSSSPTATPIPSPTASPSASASASASPCPSQSSSPTPSPSPSPAKSPCVSVTPSVTPTATPSPSSSPSKSPCVSVTPSVTPTTTPCPHVTASPSPTGTPCPHVTASPSPTGTPCPNKPPVAPPAKPAGACEKAFLECNMRFAGFVNTVPTFPINSPADRSFTPKLVWRDGSVRVGVANSNLEGDLISDTVTRRFSQWHTGARQKLTPSQFKTFAIRGSPHSGIGHETFQGNMEIAKGKCVRVRITHYQKLDGAMPPSVSGNVNNADECVVFRTAA